MPLSPISRRQTGIEYKVEKGKLIMRTFLHLVILIMGLSLSTLAQADQKLALTEPVGGEPFGHSVTNLGGGQGGYGVRHPQPG